MSMRELRQDRKHATLDRLPLRVEGVVAVADEASFEVGGGSASSGDWAYTFLASIEIVPAG